jgi:hypothetical protein
MNCLLNNHDYCRFLILNIKSNEGQNSSIKGRYQLCFGNSNNHGTTAKQNNSGTGCLFRINLHAPDIAFDKMILRFNVCMAQLFTSQAITSYASD